MYRVKVQAGYGDQINNPVFEEDLDKFYIPGNFFNDDDYRCFEVEGESMSPTYQNGDRVICSLVPHVYLSQALRDYMAYVIITEHSLLLKRVLNKIQSEKCIHLISDNAMFEPKTLAAGEIREIWKVEGLITTRAQNFNRPSSN